MYNLVKCNENVHAYKRGARYSGSVIGNAFCIGLGSRNMGGKAAIWTTSCNTMRSSPRISKSQVNFN